MVATLTSAALELSISSIELEHLDVLGTVPGVIPLLAAARNAPGMARLRTTGDGTDLQFKAPGSATWGPVVTVTANGEYLAHDGDDFDKWLRVYAYLPYLPDGHAESRVMLNQRYGVGIADDDVTASEASAGDVATYQITMTNNWTRTLTDLCAWIDPAVVDLEISDDGSTWVSPTTRFAALEFPDLAASATDILHLRRTITAGAASTPAVLNQLHLSFCGL